MAKTIETPKCWRSGLEIGSVLIPRWVRHDVSVCGYLLKIENMRGLAARRAGAPWEGTEHGIARRGRRRRTPSLRRTAGMASLCPKTYHHAARRLWTRALQRRRLRRIDR